MKHLAISTILSLFSVTTAFAAVFPDVQPGYVHFQAIEELFSAGVVTGNPDGNFYPNRTVNRAEMLTLLYRATGKVPSALTGCFSDVPRGAWFEYIVCDAAANGYVQGYGDGTFRPGQEVLRIEALKMIISLFGHPPSPRPEIAYANGTPITPFRDVYYNEWYEQSVLDALYYHIIPVAGMSPGYFYPSWPLLRGEASAMIHSAMNPATQFIDDDTSDSTDDDTVSNDNDSNANQGSSSSSSSDSGEVSNPSHPTSFPFNDNNQFNDKDPYSFTFTLSSSDTVSVVSSVERGKVTCRLYLVDDNGFSSEYYLGYQESSDCFLVTSLRPGDYQLQLQPTERDVWFDVSVDTATGDGNDGFREADRLRVGDASTATLRANDYHDFYRVTIASEGNYTINVSNSTDTTCIIFPMDDVDLVSFDFPDCNQSFRYVAGTYYIAVGRKGNRGEQVMYTIQLR